MPPTLTRCSRSPSTSSICASADAQVVRDLLRQQVRFGQARRVLKALVAQPEEVEAHFVAREDLLVGVRPPAAFGRRLGPSRLAVVAVGGAVAGDEVIEVGARHALGLEREVLVGAKVVDPHRLRPRLRRAGLPVEEEHVGLDALGVEDARRAGAAACGPRTPSAGSGARSRRRRPRRARCRARRRRRGRGPSAATSRAARS